MVRLVHVALILSSALLFFASPGQKLMTTFHSLQVINRSCEEQEASLHCSPANAVHGNLCAILVHDFAIFRREQGLGCCTAWRRRRRGRCCRARTGCCWRALGLGSQGRRAAQKQNPCALCHKKISTIFVDGLQKQPPSGLAFSLQGLIQLWQGGLTSPQPDIRPPPSGIPPSGRLRQATCSEGSTSILLTVLSPVFHGA